MIFFFIPSILYFWLNKSIKSDERDYILYEVLCFKASIDFDSVIHMKVSFETGRINASLSFYILQEAWILQSAYRLYSFLLSKDDLSTVNTVYQITPHIYFAWTEAGLYEVKIVHRSGQFQFLHVFSAKIRFQVQLWWAAFSPLSIYKQPSYGININQKYLHSSMCDFCQNSGLLHFIYLAILPNLHGAAP